MRMAGNRSCGNYSDVETITATGDRANMNGRQDELLTFDGLGVFHIVNNLVLSGTICVLGIVFNVINIVVFLKQGLTNTVKICMFAIAVSDLCSLVTLEWVNINLNPFMEKADLPYEPLDIQLITGYWPHACFFQTTTWIHVFVTAERFVCIALPLKVKQIFTPLRAKLVIGLIYLLVFLTVTPEYVNYYLGENFYPARNQTRVGLKERNIWRNHENETVMVSAIIAIVSFIILIVFTSLLVIFLKRRLKWRKSNSQSLSRKESKPVKMVCVGSAFLIMCNTPATCLCVAIFLFPGLTFDVRYRNIIKACWSFVILPDAINSTTNILFFYKMSVNYRKMFRELFLRCKQTRNNNPQI